MKNHKYFVKGAAGFIGFHLAKRLLEKGETVIGIDNLNDYYDVCLKHTRLNELTKYPDFQFIKMDIADKNSMNKLFSQINFDIVCNLAAQAGIMYSAVNPDAFIHSNIVGFINVLECCKEHGCKLIYASSSSVYGNNTRLPFSETDPGSMPKNLYAKTKINNEYLDQMYSDHFGMQTVGLRLFSVFGTFGRPDMAMMIFTKSMLNHLPICRIPGDYTNVADIVAAIEKIINYYSENKANSEIYNIGSSNPVSLSALIEKLEKQLNIKAIINYLPKRAEEIDTTFADVSRLEKVIGYKAETNIDEGIKKFVEWYKSN
jgi:UDP-glucuronate 4-epimerase